MPKIILSFLFVFFISCSSTDKKVDRGFAGSNVVDVKAGTQVVDAIQSETALGHIKYSRTKHLVMNDRAVRGYFRKSKENDGTYTFLLVEYVNLLKMAPKYILSNKASERVNNKVGYLNQILHRTAIYKALPTSDSKVFELQRMSVNNGKLVYENKSKHSKLTLAKKPTAPNPLLGAKVSKSKYGEPAKVYFPADPAESRLYTSGIQYTLANFVYNLLDGFRSTWRTAYLPGDYLGAYGDKNDVILKLNSKDKVDTADFIINEARAKMSKKKREKQLTNAKSAYISGKYDVKELEDGIFAFSAKTGDHQGKEHVDERIGLFIDIFDASQTKLKQDVVELVVLNPNDDTDFLMYYEHPDNGEGR